MFRRDVVFYCGLEFLLAEGRPSDSFYLVIGESSGEETAHS